MISSLLLILAVADPVDSHAIRGRAVATIIAGEEIDFAQFGTTPDSAVRPVAQFSRIREPSGIAAEAEPVELLLIEYQ